MPAGGTRERAEPMEGGRGPGDRATGGGVTPPNSPEPKNAIHGIDSDCNTKAVSLSRFYAVDK